MKKLLFLISCVLALSCAELTPEEEIAAFFEEGPTVQITDSETLISTQGQPVDIHHGAKFCVRELIIIAPNCWFIICHRPCLPTDPGCADFYCEWGADEENPHNLPIHSNLLTR